jgi:hypothetical protein
VALPIHFSNDNALCRQEISCSIRHIGVKSKVDVISGISRGFCARIGACALEIQSEEYSVRLLSCGLSCRVSAIHWFP